MTSQLITLDDYKKEAEKLMGEDAKIYFSAGAGYRTTPPYNEDAFQRYFIRPRVLRDMSKATMDCQILNNKASSPIGVAPTAMHNLVHADGEIASVAGCTAENCIFILSSNSSQLMENICSQANKGQLWMQLYLHDDREVTLHTVRKAEKYGISALVVTVDSVISGLWRDLMPEAILQTSAFKSANTPKTPRRYLERSVTFDDFKWLKENTYLPLIAKGILSGEDAVKIAQAGASAIIVSNHGGRMIRRVIPTIYALEEVVEAVKGMDVEVYLDGGVRSGTDVFIALALGAKAVFIGRPIIWGLCIDGEEGVQNVLRILKNEFFRTMQLAGLRLAEENKMAGSKVKECYGRE